TWTTSTTDQVVLERATSTEHFASCWFSATEFSVQVNVGAQPRKVSLYCVDYKGGNQRAERIDVLDSTTGALLDSVDLSVFGHGVYLSWNVTGAVKFQFTRTGTYNAVVSGFFIDPPAVP